MVLLVGVESGIAAGNQGCEDGPHFLRDHPEFIPPGYEWAPAFSRNTSIQDPYDQLQELYSRVAEKTCALTTQNTPFVVIGGDHSCAMGTWSGISEAIRPKGPIGLIWIDAHTDLHTPETSPSGNIHGMPVATLLGLGDQRLTHILSKQPKINPDHVVFIGIRSFEEPEIKLLKKLGIQVHFMEDVQKNGFKNTLQKAIDFLKAKTAHFGVSFDLDSLDPKSVEAVGTPVPGGLDVDETLEGLKLLRASPPVAFELVEYNPHLDKDLRTAQIIRQILQNILPK